MAKGLSKYVSALAAAGLLAASVHAQNIRRDEVIVDATHQTQRPLRGRGPFPGSDTPGHSAAFPFRLELAIPSGKPQADGTVLVDYILTNIGATGVEVPAALYITRTQDPQSIMTLWFTSDAIKKDMGIVAKSGRRATIVRPVQIGAELDGYIDDTSSSFFASSHLWLASGRSLRVHTLMLVGNFGVEPGTHSFTGHAELLQLLNSPTTRTSRIIGTADSKTIEKTLSPR